MLIEPIEKVALGVRKSTEKIGDERQAPVSADSGKAVWQMDVVEFNRNGCLINGN